MKKYLFLALLPTIVSASELKDCEKKIAELLRQVKTTSLSVAPEKRVDQYHLGKDQLCGVELLDHMLTITMFKEPKTPESLSVDAAKFETIILNESDPTFTGGRVKALVSCEINDDSVSYTTKVPVLTDGVKSPWAIEELSITKDNGELHVSLRASLIPIQKVFRSVTACTLTPGPQE